MAFYMFDVDGVLTDENAKPDKEAVKLVEDLAKEGNIVSFVTGRSRGWLSDNLFPLLSNDVDWSTLYCVAEHGAIKGRGTDISSWSLDTTYVIDDEVKELLYDVSKHSEFQGLIEWDDTKESMGTVEAVHGEPGDREHLRNTRKALQDYASKIESISKDSGNKTVVSTYGVDVIHPDLSKKIGAEWIISEVKHKEHNKVLVFGDSTGDMVMAVTAREQKYEDITFHWVGEGNAPEEDRISTVSSSASFSKGTKELLKKHTG
ncbi:HAD-IIB family hydrolase [Alkalihalobacillus sp. CinArs1]|uniref:HAD-IIB family hydrolase n=1 Tax=Alkalihalobacillus sp. CinArs1 TaxID=2995314 RepID=UPI0022DE133E|nr:HAD-IIB family hydrolase [Alkalihalobacillus sp. CinArs1]